MQITIHVNAPELAQAIQGLAAALTGSKGQVSMAPPAQIAQLGQQLVNTATPQQAAQAYGATEPISQPAPAAGQAAPTAPVRQVPVQQAPIQQASAQEQTQQVATVPTSAPSYDFNQLAAATMQLQEAGQNIFELFAQFGIQALNQLPKERYGEYANVLRERGAKL